MTIRSSPSADEAALVVNTDSSSPIDHVQMISDSPGTTGEAKRPSMWWKFAGSLSQIACSSARPVNP